MDTATLQIRTEFRNDSREPRLGWRARGLDHPDLGSGLRPFEADRAAIVLDLRDLEFCGSNAVHAFCAAYGRARADDREFALVGARPVARRVFEITETEYLLGDPAALLARFTEHEPMVRPFSQEIPNA